MVLQDVITGGNGVKRMWDFSVLFLKAPRESTMISTSLIKNVYKPLKRESKEIMGPLHQRGRILIPFMHWKQSLNTVFCRKEVVTCLH